MKVIVAGTPALAIPTAESLLATGHEIVTVLTRPDAPFGRKRVMTPSPVALWAQERDIPVIRAASIDSEVDETIRASGAEVGVVVAYGALLPAGTLDLLTHGWFNLHFSDLPRYRGAAPVQRALMAGESSIQTCVFKLVQQMDAGPVASRRTFSVSDDETAHDLLSRLSHEAADQSSEVVARIEERSLLLEAQTGTPTFAPKIDINEAAFDKNISAHENFNRFRGVTTEPGFWFDDSGVRVKVLEAGYCSTEILAGELEASDDQVLMGCASGSLRLVRVQPAGKSAMSALDWMRGRRS